MTSNGDPDPNDPKHDEDPDDSDDEEEQLVFAPYTTDSWANQLQAERDAKEREEENKRNQGEAHLVDGELQFDSEENHGPSKKRNPNLIEGGTLGEDSGFPKELYGQPVEEIDKVITDKTFVVIAPRFKREYIYRFSSTRSLFLLPPWNPLRRFLVRVATNQYFDYFIIITILTNCIFLAMPDSSFAETAEFAFLAIYTLEMIIKMLARGIVINPYTYLRDMWNWLDFIVIVSAYFTIVLEQASGGSSLGNLQGIRTFRVFRILRTVSIVPGLKTIVNALLRAFKMLLEVMMLILFVLMVFSLFALQFYKGVLRQKCVVDPPYYNATPSYTYAQYYNDHIKNSANWLQDDGEYRICGNVTKSRSCPTNYTCLKDIGENPNFGYTGFDHFGWCMLTCFQLITLDFWEDTYNKVLMSSGPWHVIFFIFSVFFGSFYLLNLMLAVVFMSYEEEAKKAGKEKRRKMRLRIQRKNKRMLTNLPPPSPPAPAIAWQLKVSVAKTAAKEIKTKITEGKKDAFSDKNMKKLGALKKEEMEMASLKSAGAPVTKYDNKSVITTVSKDNKKPDRVPPDILVIEPGEDSDDGSTGTWSEESIALDDGYVGEEEEEREKEARSKKKKKKKKKLKQEQDEKDAKEAKDLAAGANSAMSGVVAISYPHSTKISGSSTARPLGNAGPPANKDDKTRPHVQRKPMVKMPSKDSGTGNSVESSRSNGSKEGDYPEDGSNGSTVEILRKKPLLKQPSSGVVSSSGVQLSNNFKGSHDNVVEDHDHNDTPNDSDDERNASEEQKRKSKGRKYVREHYPHLTIIDVEENDYEVECSEKGHLINRNCACCWECCGGRLFVGWLYVQRVCFIICSEPLFDLFITLCIILNTLVMMMEHHDQPYELEKFLEYSNYVFSSIFIVEAIIKLSALGKHYFKVGWNNFDLLIVFVSILDFGLTDVDGLSVFRTFRLLRVFKLAQSWPTMKLLLSIIMKSLGALANLTLILCIVIYIFAVIGLQLFNKQYTADKFEGDGVPRWNFTDIFHSFMMIFRVLCGEWIEPLWDCMRAADELCMAVFLPTLLIGNFIVLSLFLALLLSSFATDSLDDSKESAEDTKLVVALKRLKDLLCCCLKKKETQVNSVGPNDEDVNDSMEEICPKENGTSGEKQKNGLVMSKETEAKGIDDAFTTKRDKFADFNKAIAESAIKEKKEKTPPVQEAPKDNMKEMLAMIEEREGKKARVEQPYIRVYTIPKNKPAPAVQEKNKVGVVALQMVENKDNDGLELGAEASTIKDKKDKEEVEDEEEEECKVLEIHDCFPYAITKRCFCLWQNEETGFWQVWFMTRVYMTMIVEHKIFEGIILFLIGASSITLAFEDVTLYSKTELKDALFWLNIIFAVFFTIEMLMKWVAFGFKKYFSSFWTILDFCIVAISLASIIAEAYGAANFSAFRALRTLRAMRPLRAISRWQGMKIVVNALMMAIPAIVNVLTVCIVFWLIFSIMGVQFFKGKFFKCVDLASGEILHPDVVGTRAQCEANSSYTWKNSKVNFDNVIQGYLALFQVATFEGWMEVMQDAIDSTKVDEQPSYENSLYMYLYFVAFIVFGAFFTLNLFIGVIIDNFNMLKKKYDGSYLDMFLTSGQRQYYNTIKKLGNKKPQKTIKRPKNKIQGVFYDIAISSKFEMCIVAVIFLNMIGMAVEHYQQTDTVTDVLSMLNILFVIVFSLEAIVKITGLRWHYFRQPWNVFDFIIVLLSLVGIILDDILGSVFVTPTLLRVVRVFRIGRVLRLIKAAKGIRKLLFALIISLPALFNIGMLLFLVMYIYAIICLSAFQNLAITGVLDEDVVNFRTFLNSFVLLFRLTTSAGWNDVLETMLVSEPDCNSTHYQRPNGEFVEESPGSCGTPWMAIFVLVSYIIIIFLVVINMFIAVIFENFSQAHEQEEVGITEDDFDMFYVVWERYDPLATQFINYVQLSNFVADLEPPLGIPKPNEIALVSFDLPIVEGDKLHCLDVLMALVRYVLGNVEETPEFKQLYDQMEVRFESAFPTRVNTTRTSSTMSRKKEDVAAKTLQRAWRSWKAQKQMKNIAALAMQQQNQKNPSGSSDNRAGKQASLRSLGNRLTSALSTFFSNPRPSSAISRISAKSLTPSVSELSVKPKVKAQSALEVPKVSTLYGNEKDGDIEL